MQTTHYKAQKVCRRRGLAASACAFMFSIALVAVLGGAQSFSAEKAAPEPPRQSAIIKSEFKDNPKFGKDPFFPKSERRGTVVDAGPTESVTVGNLVLKGISGLANHRLAIINNRTFAVGETAELKNGTQAVNIRCMEIREKSVVVKINGAARELFLSERFSP